MMHNRELAITAASAGVAFAAGQLCQPCHALCMEAKKLCNTTSACGRHWM
jgi:hypothetical protein